MIKRGLCGRDNCWRKLKALKKEEIKKGSIPSYEDYVASIIRLNKNLQHREPGIFRTTPEAEDLYEFPPYPIPGDIYERHGIISMYVPAFVLPPPKDPYISKVLEGLIEENIPIIILNPDSGCYQYGFINPQTFLLERLLLGVDFVFFDGYTVPIKKFSEETNLQWGFEFIRNKDENDLPADAEALVFTPVGTEHTYWTKAQRVYSEKRKRISRFKNSYTSRMRTKGIYILTSELPDIDPLEIYNRDKGICQLCHTPIDLSIKPPKLDSLEIDHIYPVSKGGLHALDNLQASHKKCNMKKTNKVL